MALTFETFNVDNIVFQPIRVNKKFQFSRIPIQYRYDTGKCDKLSIETPELFSWGVQENSNPSKKDEKQVDSYTMSFVMYNQKDGPTEQEEKAIRLFETVLEAIKTYLKTPEVKHELGKSTNRVYDAFVDSLDLFYRKKDKTKGGLVEGAPPTMYPKLLTKYDETRPADKAPEIITGFYDPEDNPLDPLSLVGSRCKAMGDIVIDNIYIGSNISVQCKLHDVIVIEKMASPRRLFRQRADKPAKQTKSMFDSDDEDEAGCSSTEPQKVLVRRR